MQSLQERLDYRFRQPEILARALTHASLRAERRVVNERLEFLGDAVLGLIVAEKLFSDPELEPGDMTRARAYAVSREALAERARSVGLGPLIEHKLTDLPDRALADALEAVIGAIYLDGGIEAARAVVLRLFEPLLRARASAMRDAKSLLQLAVQRVHQKTPDYRVIAADGPPHDRLFEVEVSVLGRPLATGRGRSKREAEQAAAARALEILAARAQGD